MRDVEATVFRPEKELKGFTKVALQPGEEKEVKLELNGRSFAFYNPDLKDWQVESGAFEILVGASSRDIRLSQTVAVTAVYPPSHASPLNSCFQRTGAGYCASAVCARFLIMLEKMNP